MLSFKNLFVDNTAEAAGPVENLRKVTLRHIEN